ncbi:PREDICTED: phosphatidyl-N-methylethanolamine N-methyltransferase-like [Branchiostoma belcheri]|uniref:Phosphatidylethanolamine N-methyltransferase n=1 Tax=Branchiostoma belcheri TaxID=7741 RepID=A0A6P5AK85_BRABE|nr:PREDICTED: phosphatidyl-N-methylethanolamine N-methyltransferase-like [Branchiostoma belcheri]
MAALEEYVLLDDPNMLVAALGIILKPAIWTVICRSEYRTRWMTNLFRSKYTACSVLAVTILLMGVVRDSLYMTALQSQPTLPAIHLPVVGYGIAGIGSLFVFSSFWRLGWYCTFMGDYFGIHLDERIDSFPFSVLDNPMYWGTTLNFLGVAFMMGSPAGLILCLLIVVCYKILLRLEEPFTADIYSKRGLAQKKV